MSGGWQIFLFLFCLGAACQGLNQTGLFPQVHLPDAQYSITTEQVAQINEDISNSELNIFVVYDWLIKFMKVIVSGIVAVISLDLLFYGMGWPVNPVAAAIIQIIQLPATLVVFVWLFELWTGRIVG